MHLFKNILFGYSTNANIFLILEVQKIIFFGDFVQLLLCSTPSLFSQSVFLCVASIFENRKCKKGPTSVLFLVQCWLAVVLLWCKSEFIFFYKSTCLWWIASRKLRRFFFLSIVLFCDECECVRTRKLKKLWKKSSSLTKLGEGFSVLLCYSYRYIQISFP